MEIEEPLAQISEDQVVSLYDSFKERTTNKTLLLKRDLLDSRIFKFLIFGLPAPCEGGEYLGMIDFNNSKTNLRSHDVILQPDVCLYTPNGRIEINSPIKCLSDAEWEANPCFDILLNKLINCLLDESSVLESGSIICEDETVSNLAKTSSFLNYPHQDFIKYFKPKNNRIITSSSAHPSICPRSPILRKSQQMGLKSSSDSFIIATPSPSIGNMEEKMQIIHLDIKQQFDKLLPLLCGISKENAIHPNFYFLPIVDETRDGLPVAKMAMDFSGWKYLRNKIMNDGTPADPSETFRENARKLMVSLLDCVMDVGYRKGVRIVFAQLNFEHTETSMRSIFNGTCGGKPVHRETEVEVLNLSYTKTSAQALLSLYRLRNLKELYLDYCPSLVKAGKLIFSLLTKKDPIPNLELVSVVGTSHTLSHKWLSKLEISCPKLTTVYFTQKRGSKTLGWQDPIMLQTMRRPVLLPCGHIADQNSALKLGYCGFDRKHFCESELILINPVISLLSKSDDPINATDSHGPWTIHIVDYNRNTLDSRTLFHPCGTFYNLGTLLEHFYRDDLPIDKEDFCQINDDTINCLKNFICLSCGEQLHNLRIVYPNSVEFVAEDNTFNDLVHVGAYKFV